MGSTVNYIVVVLAVVWGVMRARDGDLAAVVMAAAIAMSQLWILDTKGSG